MARLGRSFPLKAHVRKAGFLTSASDSFNRANETTLAFPWVKGGVDPSHPLNDSTMDLSSNKAIPHDSNLDCCAIYIGRTWANDQSSKATFATTDNGGGGQGLALMVRHIGASQKTGFRFAIDHGSSSNAEIARFNDGAFTSLSLTTIAWTDGDVFEFTAVGPATAAVLTVYKNGTQVATVTDTSNTISSGSPGIGSSGFAAGTIDDWIGSDIVGSTTLTAGSSLEQDYIVRAVAGKSLGESYIVESAVGASKTQGYTVFNSAGLDLQEQYAVRGAVGKSLGQSYTVFNFAGASKTQNYLIRTTAGTSLSESYIVRTSAGTSLGESYVVRGAVNATKAQQYNVRGIAHSQLGQPYVVGDATDYTNLILADGPVSYVRVEDDTGFDEILSTDWFFNGFPDYDQPPLVSGSTASILFNDSSDNMDFTDILGTSLPDGMSAELWLNLESQPEGGEFVLARFEELDATLTYFDRFGDGSFYELGWGDTNQQATTIVEFNPGDTHHIVVYYDSSVGNYGIYVDSFFQTDSSSADFDDSARQYVSNTSFWGGDPNVTGLGMDGYLDEMSIWDRVLTDTEISNHYTAGTGGSVDAAVGHSLEQDYNVRGAVGASKSLPYGVDGIVGASKVQAYGIDAIVHQSLAETYIVKGKVENLVANPSAEINITHTTNTGSPSTLIRDTANHFSGVASYKIITAAANDGIALGGTAGTTVMDLGATGVTVVGSAYIKGTVGQQVGIAISNRNSDGTQGAGGDQTLQTATLTGGWDRITTGAFALTQQYARLKVVGLGSAQTFWVDAAMVTSGTYLWSYFDGDSTQAVWHSTAEDSTSSTNNTTAPIGTSIAQSYIVRTSAGASRAQSYIIRTFAGTSLGEGYIVRTSAGQSLVEAYQVGLVAGHSLGQTYLVRTTAGTSKSQAYMVFNAAGKSLAEAYIVRAAVGTSNAEPYTILGNAPMKFYMIL